MNRVLMLCLSLLLFNAVQTTAKTFHVDPMNGAMTNDGSEAAPWSTLEEVVAAGLIETMENWPLPFDPQSSGRRVKQAGAPVVSGDTLLLYDGLHGKLFLRNYNNSDYITIAAADGRRPILESVHLQACRFWRLQGLSVSSEPYGRYYNGRLMFLESHGFQGPSARIDVFNCNVYSSEQPWTTASEWLDKVASGIYITADSVNAVNNDIRNVDMGLQAIGDYINAVGNRIVNFCGDGMRPLGSHVLFEGNVIKNCYDVDDNHDDGIQSFRVNNFTPDNVVIRGNVIINNEDENQPLAGPLQGIGCFDGFYNNWLVENNLILVNHWHGITFLGGRNCRIVNNTVLDPTPDLRPGPSWIMVANHKDGRASENCEAINNVANTLDVDGKLVNNVTLSTLDDYARNFVNPAEFDFHLLPDSELIDMADDDEASATDLDGKPRPQGGRADIGCYEFMTSTTDVAGQMPVAELALHPNPASGSIVILGLKNGDAIEVLDVSGRVLDRLNAHGAVREVNLRSLGAGVYFVKTVDSQGFVRVGSFVKQ